MLNLDPGFVCDSLDRLAHARVTIFGAESHSFVLNAPLAEQFVQAFEERYRIRLPEDYRHFITQIGNGGAGPDYGLFPFGYRDPGVGSELEAWSEGDGFVGVLSQPFQFDEPWNDTSGLPDLNLSKDQQEEFDRQMEVFETRYWSSALMNGSLPICHRGCAIRLWLVVTGKEAGHVWRDDRAEYTGLSPLVQKDGSRATFLSWYSGWLEDCLARI